MNIELQKTAKMTDAEYFSIDRISNSFLIAFDRAPAYAFIEREETAGMKAGTMFHKFILEPEDFDRDYVVIPKMDKRTKEFKEVAVKYAGKEIVFDEDVKDLTTARHNIYSYDFEGESLENYFTHGEREIPVMFDYAGIPAKGKIDCLYEQIDGSFIIFDLKKTQDCRAFQKSINEYKYYRQAAFYIEAVAQLKGVDASDVRFIFVTVEENAPNGVKLYELTGEYITAGDRETMKTVDKYRKWLASGADKTELYTNDIVVLDKPNWMN